MQRRNGDMGASLVFVKSLVLGLLVVTSLAMVSGCVRRQGQATILKPSETHMSGQNAADLYVATNGSDAWSGKLAQPNKDKTDGPLATLARARDVVRQLKKAPARKDIVVLLRGGTYRLDETLVFSLEDSAPEGGSITYAAYPGERPMLSSGVPIRNWRRPEVPPELVPQGFREKIWVADLPAGMDKFLTLYDGMDRLTRARGEGFAPPVFMHERNDPPTQISFPPGKMKNWPDIADAELLVIPNCDYEMCILPLKSVDEANGIAHAVYPASRSMGRVKYMDKTAWVENILEAVKQPGDWVVNAAERKVYLWPKGDQPSDDIVAPKLTELVRVEGGIDYDGPADKAVTGITFRGLTFSHAERYAWRGYTGWDLQHHWEMFDRPTAALRFRGAEGCTVQACRFVATSGTGVRFDLTAQHNRIIDNEVGHVGGVGILLCGYGPGTKDVNGHNEVINNWVHNVGELYWASPGIMLWQSGSNRVANNLIRNTPYSGIAVSGRIGMTPDNLDQASGRTVRWKEVGELKHDDEPRLSWYERERFLHGRKNLVEHNDIHDVMEVMGDGNGVYVSGTGKENHIFQNYIHHSDGDGMAGGIRCDNDQYETIVEGNIIYHIRATQSGIATTEMNHILNNVIVDILPSRRPIPAGKKVLGYICVPPGVPIDGARILRNICYSTRKDYLPIIKYGSFSRGAYDLLKNTQTDYNLYWCSEDPNWAGRHLAEQRAFGVETHSIIADPMFVDAEKGDLLIRPESPAWKLGFQPIDMTQIGLLPNHPHYPGKAQTQAQ
ncbi:MAG: right-handed parallel beta-helix repeat-containing protein [Phycisphaerae bacterium]|jgi:parallel beta-helix repeat protein